MRWSKAFTDNGSPSKIQTAASSYRNSIQRTVVCEGQGHSGAVAIMSTQSVEKLPAISRNLGGCAARNIVYMEVIIIHKLPNSSPFASDSYVFNFVSGLIQFDLFIGLFDLFFIEFIAVLFLIFIPKSFHSLFRIIFTHNLLVRDSLMFFHCFKWLWSNL